MIVRLLFLSLMLLNSNFANAATSQTIRLVGYVQPKVNFDLKVSNSNYAVMSLKSNINHEQKHFHLSKNSTASTRYLIGATSNMSFAVQAKYKNESIKITYVGL